MDEDPRPLVWVSGRSRVGKSTIACGLATALATRFPTTLIQIYRGHGETPTSVERWILDPERCVDQVSREVFGDRLARRILATHADTLRAFAVLQYIHRRVHPERRVVVDVETSRVLGWLRAVRALREGAGLAPDMVRSLEQTLFGSHDTELWVVTRPDEATIQDTRSWLRAVRRERTLPTRLVVNALAAEQDLPRVAARFQESSLATLARTKLPATSVPVLDNLSSESVSRHLVVPTSAAAE